VAAGGGSAPLGGIDSLYQQAVEECQARMRWGELPKLVDIRADAFEVIRLESRFGLCNQIDYLLRVLRRVNNTGRGRKGRLTL
jgi:hypothetical protein